MDKTMNDDTIVMEPGELSESQSESEPNNLFEPGQQFLKKRRKIYKIRFKRTAPYWLASPVKDNAGDDNGDGDGDDDGDNEREQNLTEIPEDKELEGAMLAYIDKTNVIQFPPDKEDFETSMCKIEQ